MDAMKQHRWAQFLAAVRREIPSWETAATDAQAEIARLTAALSEAQRERDAATKWAESAETALRVLQAAWPELQAAAERRLALADRAVEAAVELADATSVWDLTARVRGAERDVRAAVAEYRKAGK